jgi:hypothetical protein
MSARRSKPMALLEFWRVIRTRVGSRHLIGVVSGHSRLRDGSLIITSDIVDVRFGPGQPSEVEPVNTLYVLVAAVRGAFPANYADLADEVLPGDWEPGGLSDL